MELCRPEFIGPRMKVHLLDEGYVWVQKTQDFVEDSSEEFGKSKVSVTPQTRGSVDYPSTRRIQVEVGLPDATFRKWGRVFFVQGALPKYNACIKPAFTCPKQSNIIPKITTWIKTASWAHKTISINHINHVP